MMGRPRCSKGTRSIAEPCLERARPGAEAPREMHPRRGDGRGGTKVDVQSPIGLCKRSAR